MNSNWKLHRRAKKKESKSRIDKTKRRLHSFTQLQLFILIATARSIALGQSTQPLSIDGKWETIQLTNEFWAEGACAADVNLDGDIDVICGPFWYAGPNFKKRTEIYPATAEFRMLKDGAEITIRGFKGFLSGENGYSDNFLSYSYDVNSDSWPDYIVVGHPGEAVYWFDNPGSGSVLWKKHLAAEHVDNESPQMLDVTGDKKPELLCMKGGNLGFLSPGSNVIEPWEWNPVTKDRDWKWNTHGLGAGDVNGDDRTDLITSRNWWEQPADLSSKTPWISHDAIFSDAGAQMYAFDVDGDGLNDVITSNHAHEYGILWHQHTREDGVDGWIKHVIAGTPELKGETGVIFSQPHSLFVADINGDGRNDIVTGKRFWAHGPNGDAEPNAPAVLLWFESVRKGGATTFIAHPIHNDSGVGTQVMAIDVNKDGKPDVIVGNKKGLFVHLQR